jgi:hypothetical protein
MAYIVQCKYFEMFETRRFYLSEIEVTVIIYAQLENFSITSIEVDFWGVKSSGCENSHATEVKCSNIPQKS